MNVLPKYRSHKIVEAAKIDGFRPVPDNDGTMVLCLDGVGDLTTNAGYRDKHNPSVGGYYVRYEDGYESYSPANAFETGYTRIES